MRRRRGFLAILVVLVVAIFTIQTTQVVSAPVQEKQTARDAKSDGGNAEKLLAESDCRSCHAADRKVVEKADPATGATLACPRIRI